nr:ClpXP protease specificity-enhancing factor [Verticiella sp. GG226]
MHEWCTDNGYTPYLSVAVDEHTVVPREHVRDGMITLNVGTLATHKLQLGNDYVEFQARFGGVSRQISVPITAVRAIYARETGQGMAFEPSDADVASPPPAHAEAAPQRRRPAHRLRRIAPCWPPCPTRAPTPRTTTIRRRLGATTAAAARA